MGKLPSWFRVRYGENEASRRVGCLVSNSGLHTVCTSARCPNRFECWSQGTASFMILGEVCTRACRFCAVKTSPKPPPPDPLEPEKLAEAIASLSLRYVVITSVTRDDLPDGGAGHFAECVRRLREKSPELIIETLVPDFHASESMIRRVVDAAPDVVSHNIETVERLTPEVRDRRASYAQSLETLRLFREASEGRIITKSGIMAGLGETPEEIGRAMDDLRGVGVELLTIGQYLSPGERGRNLPVKEFVTPEIFAEYEKLAHSKGFVHVASGPLVRSSYRAAEPFISGMLKPRTGY